jgi:hypothetical protein
MKVERDALQRLRAPRLTKLTQGADIQEFSAGVSPDAATRISLPRC